MAAAAAAAVAEDRPATEAAASDAERRMQEALECPCLDDLKGGSCGSDFTAGAPGVACLWLSPFSSCPSPLLTPPPPHTQRSAASCVASRRTKAQTAPTRSSHCRHENTTSRGPCQPVSLTPTAPLLAGVFVKTRRRVCFPETGPAAAMTYAIHTPPRHASFFSGAVSASTGSWRYQRWKLYTCGRSG